jgi:hypothetical protein
MSRFRARSLGFAKATARLRRSVCGRQSFFFGRVGSIARRLM